MFEYAVACCLCLAFVSALVAGVFQSFSDFVMAGLARSQPAGGIESMQHINRTVLQSVFLTAFLTLVPLTILFAVVAVLHIDGPASGLVVAAAVIYFALVFLVTVAGNVPMNRRLEAMDHTSGEAAGYWQTYCRRWTRLNHVRTVGSAATAALLLVAAVFLIR